MENRCSDERNVVFWQSFEADVRTRGYESLLAGRAGITDTYCSEF
jgi:hypothetical protein